MSNVFPMFADRTMTIRATRQAIQDSRKRVFRKARRQRIAIKESFLAGM